MASLRLSQDELRAIETSRRNLQQLSNTIGSLKAELYRGNPLPPSSSLEASASILQRNLDSLQRIIAENADFFQRVAVHPSTNYPGHTQEGILIQLLRKKPEPDVESWAEDGAVAALAAGVDAVALTGGAAAQASALDGAEDEDDEDEDGYREEADPGGMALDPLGEVWADVRQICIERVEEFVKNESQDVYTAKERAMGIEKVRTGLRRNLEDDSDEDEDDEEEGDDEDDAADEADSDLQMLEAAQGAAVPTAGGALAGGALAGGAPAAGVGQQGQPSPEQLLWFAARGDQQLPNNIEFVA